MISAVDYILCLDFGNGETSVITKYTFYIIKTNIYGI